MNSQEFCSHLDELFEVDPGTVKMTDKLQDFSNWDSLRFLGLISMVDAEYEVMLTPKFVLESQSVQEVFDRISTELSADQAA